MRFPSMRLPETQRVTRETFLGYNAGDRIGDGEFSDMENLSSDRFPLLSVRRRRGIYARPGNVQGMIAKDALCYVDGSKFVINGYKVELGLSIRAEDCPKQLVSMGAYVVIFPDKKYINTADLTDCGSLEAEVTTRTEVRYSPCTLDGAEQVVQYVQSDAPRNPENQTLWLDTSQSPGVLKQWSESAAMWTEAAASYVKISAPGIGAAFRQYDGVLLSGLPEKAAALEGYAVIWDRGEDYLLVPGLLEESFASAAAITVSRRVPRMDFVVESGNRLWGCRYGVDGDGTPLNEIYACKLGDFRNWNCFMGLTTDSYAVSLGADGPFTGAASHMGYPVFFREGCLHKIYGNYPANYRVQTTSCRGVQRGSHRSLAQVGELLFYKSPGGVCAYDGALPVEISQALGTARYSDAAAGAFGNKYYISMRDAGGEYQLFVYDSARNLWHREDAAGAVGFCACREELYYLGTDGAIHTVLGTGEQEGKVSWMAQTGDLGAGSPGGKYLSRVIVNAWMEQGAKMRVLVRYDGCGLWEEAAKIGAPRLGSVSVPLRLRRCCHLQLRLEGSGEARLYALTLVAEQGSDVL